MDPLLFIFYINDIISVINTLKINMYADDCVLYISGNDWNRMVLKIQPEIDNIQTWCQTNRLKLNINKSKTLVFGSRNKLGNIDYNNVLHIGGVPLEFTDKYKYLGVTLDKEMTLNCLLSDIKKTVSNRLFNFRKLRRYITEQSAITIYKQIILPAFDYAGFMLISCNKSDRYDLHVIQNDVLRTCYNVKRRDKLSISNMHKKANLLSLEQRRTFQLLSLMCIHKGNRMNLIVPPRNTRAATRDKFYVERYKNIKYRNSLFYKGAELWKLLPMDIVTSGSLFEFKQLLKKQYKSF